MGCDDENVGQKPFRIDMVRGEPYYIGERKLTPVARMISFGKASATIGNDRLGGWGGGFVSITPLALLEETATGEQRIAIQDTTRATVMRLGRAALAITFLFTALRWWLRRQRRALSDRSRSAALSPNVPEREE
jgi:hypothetical protein